jgi:hypothetical protein
MPTVSEGRARQAGRRRWCVDRGHQEEIRQSGIGFVRLREAPITATPAARKSSHANDKV